jgi:hypothetical protein
MYSVRTCGGCDIWPVVHDDESPRRSQDVYRSAHKLKKQLRRQRLFPYLDEIHSVLYGVSDRREYPRLFCFEI